jgi:hypothetical protein
MNEVKVETTVLHSGVAHGGGRSGKKEAGVKASKKARARTCAYHRVLACSHPGSLRSAYSMA